MRASSSSSEMARASTSRSERLSKLRVTGTSVDGWGGLGRARFVLGGLWRGLSGLAAPGGRAAMVAPEAARLQLAGRANPVPLLWSFRYEGAVADGLRISHTKWQIDAPFSLPRGNG